MDRRKDHRTRTRLDDIHDEYKRSARIVGLLVVVVVIQGALGYWLLTENRERDTDIQQQRVDTLVVLCNERNFRNQETIKILDLRVEELSKGATEERKMELRQNYAFTVSLINALAPFEKNCEGEAERLALPHNWRRD